MNYLEYVEFLMESGLSEEDACREADYYFSPAEYNADDYDN